jgi:hypothetical protein
MVILRNDLLSNSGKQVEGVLLFHVQQQLRCDDILGIWVVSGPMQAKRKVDTVEGKDTMPWQ